MLAVSPATAGAAGDPHVRTFVTTIMSFFDGSASARRAGTAHDDRLEHREWIASTGGSVLRRVTDGRPLFRRIDGHGGRKNRIVTRNEIRTWVAAFDRDHNGLSDEEASRAWRAYERLVKSHNECPGCDSRSRFIRAFEAETAGPLCSYRCTARIVQEPTPR